MSVILIIEDESDIAELVAYHLEKEGHKAVVATDGVTGLTMAEKILPDLILLDLMLPGMLGTEVCKFLKKKEVTAGIPIVVVSAKGDEIDRVVGFELGVDDYVVKPFSMRELLLRVKARLRLSAAPNEGTLLKVGQVTIDHARHEVYLDGQPVSFTTTEYKLLHTLAKRLGRVQTRDDLLRDVWENHHAEDTRTVDTHITRVRTKLGDAGEQIKTVRGFGYKMEEK